VAGSRSPDWLLWQLVDSAFPTGGFAHSGGLEATWQHGEVRTRVELGQFLETALEQAAPGLIPFVTAVHALPDRFREVDSLCDAITTNHVANRASRAQGRALLAAAGRVFGVAEPPDHGQVHPSHSHWAPAFGYVAGRLEIARGTAVEMFVYNHLRGLLAAAVRLNIVGPMEAQMLQFRLGDAAAAAARRGAGLGLDDIAQTAPLTDVWQGAQDRLYSRLFQS
jgi:urease accessory protein